MGLLSFFYDGDRRFARRAGSTSDSANLQRTLERERARADRTGAPVSWSVFRLEGAKITSSMLRRLAEVVYNRARLTDEIGWLEDTELCAILPATDLNGAHCFSADAVRFIAEAGLHPDVLIYSYPLAPPASIVPSNRTLDNVGVDRRSSIEVQRNSRQAPSKAHSVCHSFSGRGYFVKRMPWWKRCLDIAGASAALLMLSPVMAFAACAVKLSSSGPVVFAQQRAGAGGNPFTMYKFRSMYVDAEARKAELAHLNEQDGPAFKIKDDPRITPIGRILRKLSIDELPQLLNVLEGTMSLVGPRPPTFDEVAKYCNWYSRRLDVTPGITCVWQVHGRARVTFEDWMRMDMQYIRKYSLRQDLTLLFATIPAVLFRRGAH